MSEWVMCGVAAGLCLGWALIDEAIPRDGFKREIVPTGINMLVAFGGGMLLMWSFVLGERLWLSAALMASGFVVGALGACALEAIRFWVAAHKAG